MQRFFSYKVIIIFSVLILITSLLPFKSSKAIIPFLDKIIHSLIYAVLSFIGVNTLYLRKHPQARVLSFFYAFSLGIFIEVLQFFTSYRSFDINDIFSNLLGSILGVLFKVV